MFLLALIIHAAPPGLQQDVDRSERNDLFVFATATGGANLLDVDPHLSLFDGRSLFVMGVRAGFRASRPPVASGGGRLGLMPTLALRYEPATGRTEWLADAGLTIALPWKLMNVVSVGYGLSSVRGSLPSPFFSISDHLVVVLDGLWIGVGIDGAVRTGGGRTLAGSLTVGWQLELFD